MRFETLTRLLLPAAFFAAAPAAAESSLVVVPLTMEVDGARFWFQGTLLLDGEVRVEIPAEGEWAHAEVPPGRYRMMPVGTWRTFRSTEEGTDELRDPSPVGGRDIRVPEAATVEVELSYDPRKVPAAEGFEPIGPKASRCQQLLLLTAEKLQRAERFSPAGCGDQDFLNAVAEYSLYYGAALAACSSNPQGVTDPRLELGLLTATSLFDACPELENGKEGLFIKLPQTNGDAFGDLDGAGTAVPFVGGCPDALREFDYFQSIMDDMVDAGCTDPAFMTYYYAARRAAENVFWLCSDGRMPPGDNRDLGQVEAILPSICLTSDAFAGRCPVTTVRRTKTTQLFYYTKTTVIDLRAHICANPLDVGWCGENYDRVQIKQYKTMVYKDTYISIETCGTSLEEMLP